MAYYARVSYWMENRNQTQSSGRVIPWGAQRSAKSRGVNDLLELNLGYNNFKHNSSLQDVAGYVRSLQQKSFLTRDSFIKKIALQVRD